MVRKIDIGIASCPANSVPPEQIDEKTRERMAHVQKRLEQGLKEIKKQEARAWEKARLHKYR